MFQCYLKTRYNCNKLIIFLRKLVLFSALCGENKDDDYCYYDEFKVKSREVDYLSLG